MSQPVFGPCPPRFAEIKRQIAVSYPDFETRVTKAWVDLLSELDKVTEEIASQGSDSIPHVQFSALENLPQEKLDVIRRRGCVVIKDVVDDVEATSWKDDLREYVKANPVQGFPEEDKQFFQLYWTKSQVRARADPNVLAATAWLNKFYHVKSQQELPDVDLFTPLSYADRFRMRHPGNKWYNHPPHIDGGGIERWEDDAFRSCFADILNGNWRQHDPYDLEGRINARNSLYGRPNQSSIFRTYQGWLALSEITPPNQGTLQVFPDVLLSNTYIILRPFFKPVSEDISEADLFKAENWKFDITSEDFPGIYSLDKGYSGPRPKTETHPHLRLDKTMVSVPKVKPGDMVFWHCDVIHAVEIEHTGIEDSCVMYIPAMPNTPVNAEYVQRQRESFLAGVPPPDFPKWEGEAGFAGIGTPDDIVDPIGKQAMGFAVSAAA
ncbi:uncharacterized protein PHACADRAFT_258661 [Phanerochaete carnosa HHB-10118-sp]|uniref:DUF1479-domain-containing protein n=1 Tax=Phanerochaete carnosa (strain HHB-10118-sp) TaxID=650164 RepID=K5WW34_PHACS|nr:uncharacterized protein PHACADRAFT_258661 [Phanerochaete carnosa HHB-10118-sp]EKM54672.1 hypothetical protein PHACADRAFT_258661 [Phanerochaete carnosa HHB-10118-sp]